MANNVKNIIKTYYGYSGNVLKPTNKAAQSLTISMAHVPNYQSLSLGNFILVPSAGATSAYASSQQWTLNRAWSYNNSSGVLTLTVNLTGQNNADVGKGIVGACGAMAIYIG